MAKEITVTGQKKVITLQKEFNEKYPFIRLNVYSLEEKVKRAQGKTIYAVDNTKTIAAVRTKVCPGSITITGNKLVKTLEREFDDIFGLYVEISFTTKEGKRFYTRSDASGLVKGKDDTREARINGDDMTLAALNRLCEQDECQKGVWN